MAFQRNQYHHNILVYYYFDNKVEKFFLDHKRKLLIDIPSKTLKVEIKPSKIYFDIYKNHSNFIKRLFNKK